MYFLECSELFQELQIQGHNSVLVFEMQRQHPVSLHFWRKPEGPLAYGGRSLTILDSILNLSTNSLRNVSSYDLFRCWLFKIPYLESVTQINKEVIYPTFDLWGNAVLSILLYWGWSRFAYYLITDNLTVVLWPGSQMHINIMNLFKIVLFSLLLVIYVSIMSMWV